MKLVLNTAVLATFAMVGLVGCGGDKSADNKTAASTTETTTTAETATAGNVGGVEGGKKYTVLVGGTPEPFIVQDEKGAFSGLEVDIVKEVAIAEGFAVEFYEMPISRALGAVESGEYDMSVGGYNYSDERSSKYGLSNAYFFNPAAFVYKKDASTQPKTLAELNGLTVAVVEGTRQDGDISALSGVTAVKKGSAFAAYKAMLNGEVQVAAYDMVVLQHLLKKHNDTVSTVVAYEDKTNKNTTNVAIINKNNTELLAKFNEGLDKLEKSGKLAEISKQYLGE